MSTLIEDGWTLLGFLNNIDKYGPNIKNPLLSYFACLNHSRKIHTIYKKMNCPKK